MVRSLREEESDVRTLDQQSGWVDEELVGSVSYRQAYPPVTGLKKDRFEGL